MTLTSVPRAATVEKARGALARERRARADAEVAGARASLLARTSAALDGSLELEHTLRALAGVCVPELASLVVIHVSEEDGRTHRFALRAAAGEGHTVEQCATYPPGSGPSLSEAPAIAEGDGFLLTHVTDIELPPLLTGVDHAGLWSGLLPASLMCAPLRVGTRTVGAIGLVAGMERRPFDTGDLELLRAIAARASLAIGNSRSYDKARRASALRDDVLAVVSHDLRNPLATIAMALSRLSDDSEITPHRREELLSIARASVDWMQRMIQDLLDVASIDSGRLSIERRDSDPLMLLVLSGTMFEQAFADQGVRFTTDFPERLPRVNVDPERMLQLLGNLLSNAVKFAPRGSEVTLSATERGRDLLVSVRDRGPGIPAADVPHVFDRFWHARRTARVRGTGLGLSIAKGIVDAHGGRIWVDTSEGAGSTFSFSLPRSAAETPPREVVYAMRYGHASEAVLSTRLSTAV